MVNFELTDNTSLFLDRDGVINVRKMGGYVQSYDEFHFIEGVKEAMKIFHNKFAHIFIVTNQQGIGKGLMTEEAFETISQKMITEIEEAGGRIDKIYHCSDIKEKSSPNRKPNVGMAFMAAKDFPQVVFSDSVMVGDSNTDLIFGKRCGMHTIFIDNHTETDMNKELIDEVFDSLFDYAKSLK